MKSKTGARPPVRMKDGEPVVQCPCGVAELEDQVRAGIDRWLGVRCSYL